LIGSFRSEWLRLTRRPAVWILAVVLLAILLTLSYALVWIIFSFPPKGLVTQGGTPQELKRVLYPADWLHTVLGDTTGLGGSVALILGVLTVGSEYGWGTVKTMVTQRPGRLQVLLGKALAMEAILLVLSVALLAAGAAASAVLVTVDGQSSSWPDVLTILKAVGTAWLVLSLYAGLGFMLAVVFRQSALAVGLGLVYTFVIESLVLNLLGNAEAFRGIVSAFPGSNAAALIATFPSAVVRPGAAVRAHVGAGQATLVLGAYLAAFAAVSAALFRRRDIA
jgi:ABC-2 type transport system permease protein